jgi:hypothetical protein
MTTYVLIPGAWHGAWCFAPWRASCATAGTTSIR